MEIKSFKSKKANLLFDFVIYIIIAAITIIIVDSVASRWFPDGIPF